MSRLLEHEIEPNPFDQFRAWFAAAVAAKLAKPEAMTLATATPAGRPSARMVLLKGVDNRGFVFFTNYESRKGAELEANPQAALLFHWDGLERQVRIEGEVERVSPAESDAYFHSRPWGSRLSACASPQSQVVPSREVLERRVQELESQYPNEDVPRPAWWGGYRVLPASIEFWQGGLHRLHDRLCYYRKDDGSWEIKRLAP